MLNRRRIKRRHFALGETRWERLDTCWKMAEIEARYLGKHRGFDLPRLHPAGSVLTEVERDVSHTHLHVHALLVCLPVAHE